MTLSASQHDRARTLFLEARKLRPDQRDAFLDGACPDDPIVLSEVRVLLAHDDAPDELLQPDAARIGTTISHYRITGLIASGGMGVVYEAEQATPHRTIALKLIRHAIPSRNALRRFRLETEVLARLRHPAIAQIYEAGTHEEPGGQVAYFAMELVERASPITCYAADGGLSLRKRVELFITVCDAVHHGHQRGIIHRDLKPSNILVDAEGHPKIIDFGVARSTDADIAVTTQHTETGALIGTLQYMSPEQCAADPLDIDTRADVYSLGVVLFEICCGRVPYDVSTASLVQATRMVCDAPIPRPRSTNRHVRGDLERIVLKALERDRAKRYQSAAALAEDLQRFLDAEPVSARPPGLLTSATRWIIRHPIWTTSFACSAIALLSLGLTYLYISWYELQPSAIVCHAGASQIQLLSRSGHVLWVWDRDPDEGSPFAELVRAPDGRLLAVTGYLESPAPQYSRQLEVADTSKPSVPLWSTSDPQRAIVPPEGSNPHAYGHYNVGRVLVADIFENVPGSEIVAVHGNNLFSPQCIRIYSLSGTILYEAWHDGGASRIYWMSVPRELVACGESCEREWPDYGVKGVTLPPLAIFALQPVLGRRAGWLHGPRQEGDSDLAWYKYLLPPEASDQLAMRTLDPPPDPQFNAQRVTLVISMRDGSGDFAWTLDEHGLLVGDPIITDPLRRKDPSFSPNDVYFLSDSPVSHFPSRTPR